MECPKCRKSVSDSDYDCPYCGTKIKSMPENPKRGKRVRVKAKSADDNKSKKRRSFFSDKKSKANEISVPKQNRVGRFKLIAGMICAVIIVILLIVVISSVLSSKGEKYAEIASKYIGNDLSVLKGEEDMHFLDESEYFGVNSSVSFDYVMESDKKIKSDGVSYPSWAVFLNISDVGFITDVTYTDFSVIDGDMRGHKHDSPVSLDSFDKGEKQNKVLNFIDMSPYSITYSQSGITTYTYKYYFKRDNGDEQQVILRAAFDEDGTYEYYTSELIYPQNM